MVVYPRWRGELIYSKPSECIPGGLSPLARGTHIQQTFRMHSGRFIPAGAGNSPSASSPALDISVYPRWRGELWFTHATSERVDGLSPLARGTQGRRYPRSATPRFIPAGAGNSRIVSLLRRPNSVYPRWRGELGVFDCTNPCAAGLSPLARGTPRRAGDHRHDPRFIPAGAGNSVNITYY